MKRADTTWEVLVVGLGLLIGGSSLAGCDVGVGGSSESPESERSLIMSSFFREFRGKEAEFSVSADDPGAAPVEVALYSNLKGCQTDDCYVGFIVEGPSDVQAIARLCGRVELLGDPAGPRGVGNLVIYVDQDASDELRVQLEMCGLRYDLRTL